MVGERAHTEDIVDFEDVVEGAGKTIDIAGIVIIVAGVLLATAVFARSAAHRPFHETYTSYRHGLGRALLLGLELLVAGDIIRTVAIDPSLESVAVLAGIVLIRTFLSMSLEAEIEGRWPWQQKSAATAVD